MTNRPNRVLHVVYAMNTGGVESWLMAIYRKIDRSRIQFDFLVNTQEKAFFDAEIEQMGGKVIYAGPLNNPFKIYKTAQKTLCTGEYQAVHCHNVENATPVLKASINNNINSRIYHSHNNLANEVSHLSFAKRSYVKISRLLALKYANKYLAVSRSAGDSLFGDKSYQFLSLGIDVERFNPDIETNISKNDFGLKKEDFVVGHVGRFDIHKNHDFFLKIARKLIEMNPNTKFLFVGEGVLKDKIQAEIHKKGLEDYFLFAGLRNDVPDIMNNVMDAFLFPSLSEGLGLVLVEAQAAGLPAVCSEVIPDEAIVNTELVKKLPLASNPQEWADALLDNYNKNKRYEKLKAYKVVVDSPFNLNNTIERLEKMWLDQK